MYIIMRLLASSKPYQSCWTCRHIVCAY